MSRPVPPPDHPEKDESPLATRAAIGVFAGFALLAAVNACAIVVGVPLPSGGLVLRLAHLAFDAAETLGVGGAIALVVLVAVAACERLRLRGWQMKALLVAVTIAIVLLTIREPITRVASHALAGRFASAIFVAYVAGIALGFSEVLGVAVFLAGRPRWRVVPVAVGVVSMAIDQAVLRDDYFGMHCVLAWGAAMVAGAAMAAPAERVARAALRRRSGRAGLAAFSAFALFGLLWPPANSVRIELFRQPCAIASWVLASISWRSPPLHAPVSVPPSPWNEDRSHANDVPPTTPALLPRDAVVVLITIDALRAGALLDPANDALFPSFAALRARGVVFTHASAPGAQTASSLSTLFSGRYYSERHWADHGVGDTRYLFPADDPVPYFPELLSAHGVKTANDAGLFFLSQGFGVLGGFRDERVVVTGRRHAEAGELIAPMLDRLKAHEAGPLFFYTHLLDPHRPYDRGRPDGTDYERYLSEVAITDGAVGRVVRELEVGFGKRWAIFVAADHGEAFGEHQSYEHAKTLYEELLHVPLLARSPAFPARKIDERVGVIDLGPTILDLFGVPTPATFNGQSLVPILGGGSKDFTRPLLAEGRLRRALTQPDGLKVIDDTLRKDVEVYDLAIDPGETRNLWDDPASRSRADVALATLRAFFATHTRRDGGYEPPYMP